MSIRQDLMLSKIRRIRVSTTKINEKTWLIARSFFLTLQIMDKNEYTVQIKKFLYKTNPAA
jgi:hypothetical protein